jgi:outer membrane protein assembly factor BamA
MKGLSSILGVTLVAAAVSGCASRRPPAVDTQVKSVHFKKNGPWLSARSDAALRQAMAHPTPRGVWPFRRNVDLDEEQLAEDKRRLAVHYAHEGFFDARVERWEIIEVKPATEDRPPVVKIVGHVQPGEHSVADRTRVNGAERLSTPIRRTVKRTLLAPPGDRFRLADHEARIEEARTELANLSFARASIDGQAEVDRDAREVDFLYDVEPGDPAVFGEITVEGAEGLPPAVVDQAVFIEPGDAFSAEHLGEVQKRLYGLGVFSSVDIRPDTSGSGDVPVTVSLTRRDPRGVEAAGGIALESGRQEVLGRAGFEHLNAFDRLLQLELDAMGGYAFLASSLPTGLDSFRGVRGGPIAEVTAAASVPVWSWRARLEAGYEHDITEAFVTDQPSLTTSLSGPLAPKWTLSLAYRLTYNLYSDVQVDPGALRALEQAPDLQEGQYFDTHLEQTLLWDTRDDVLAPTRGFRHSVTLKEAGRWLGGNYDYLGGELDLRAYQPMGRLIGQETDGLVLAGRVGGGYLQPYGPEERRAVPVAERLYLGGSGSVRGWIYQHLGPYVCSFDSDSSCASEPGDDAEAGDDTVPVGGRVSSMGSLEVRRNWERFGAVAFVDAGMVWARPDLVGEIPVLPSVGIGARLKTPVGPVRGDVAVRTDNTDMFEQEPRVWMHLGIGEAF